MIIKCKKCNRYYSVHPIPSKEFIVADYEKFSNIIFIGQKKYLAIKCDRCRCINIEEIS